MPPSKNEPSEVTERWNSFIKALARLQVIRQDAAKASEGPNVWSMVMGYNPMTDGDEWEELYEKMQSPLQWMFFVEWMKYVDFVMDGCDVETLKSARNDSEREKEMAARGSLVEVCEVLKRNKRVDEVEDRMVRVLMEDILEFEDMWSERWEWVVVGDADWELGS